MIVVLLHKYILTKNFHTSLSYLIVEFVGKKKQQRMQRMGKKSTKALEQ